MSDYYLQGRDDGERGKFDFDFFGTLGCQHAREYEDGYDDGMADFEDPDWR
jgi:hypothetical protein